MYKNQSSIALSDTLVVGGGERKGIVGIWQNVLFNPELVAFGRVRHGLFQWNEVKGSGVPLILVTWVVSGSDNFP